MIIKSIFLESFGRFNNTKFEFKDGINLIYGDNEAGKSTIHSFIDGIFYGFLKPNTKTTLYLSTHEKYRPWNDVNYKGLALISKGETDIQIWRNFLKGVEETKVTDLLTGEDLTKSYAMGNSNRVLQPGYELFGVNGSVFKNTLSIGQLGLMTDSKLVDEIRDRITQSSIRGDDNISVEKALEKIDSQLKEIGSLRAPTSYYYRLNSQIEELKNTHNSLMISKEDYIRELDKLDGLKGKREEVKEEIKNLKGKNTTILLWDRNVNLRRREDLIDKIKNFEIEIGDLKEFESIDIEMLDRALELSTLERIQRAKLEKSVESINYLEDKLSKINILSQDEIDEIDAGIEEYNQFMKLDSNFENHEVNIELELVNSKKKLKSRRILLGAIIALYIILQITTFNIENLQLRYLVHFVLIPIIYILISNRSLKSDISKYLELNGYLKKMEEIISKANCSSMDEYFQVIEDRKSKKIANNRIKDEKNQLQEELDEISRDYSNELQENQIIHDQLTEILLHNKVTDIEEYKESVKLKRRLLAIKEDNQLTIEELENINKILTNFELNEKGHEVTEKPDFYDERYEIVDRIDKLNDILKELEVDISSSQIRIRSLEDDKSKEDFVSDELKRKEEELNSLESTIRTLGIARDRILKISMEMHREFAPIINKEVGKLFQAITQNKYKGVRIDNQLNLSVIDASDRLIDISSLSGGTIDQLYFSLRIALSNHIMGKDMPLFLDESFAHYDNKRLENILSFLDETFKGRQIFIFTCHEREGILMDQLGIKYNYVSLC